VVGRVIDATLTANVGGGRGTEMPSGHHRVVATSHRTEALTVGHNFTFLKVDILATRRIAVTVAPILKHECLRWFASLRSRQISIPKATYHR
jgi:hypothetical protein